MVLYVKTVIRQLGDPFLLASSKTGCVQMHQWIIVCEYGELGTPKIVLNLICYRLLREL